jgi:hypothetical protein
MTTMNTVIQLFSVSLAFTGTVLAWIDCRHSSLKQLIENYIDDLGRITFPPRTSGTLYKHTWKIFISIEITTMILTYIIMYLENTHRIQQHITLPIRNHGLGYLLDIAVFLSVVVLPIILPIVTLRLLRITSNVLNRMSEGHAFASMGFVLSFIGLFMAFVSVAVDVIK